MVRDGFPYDSNATECEKYTPKLLSDGWANVAYILLFAPAAGAVFSPGVKKVPIHFKSGLSDIFSTLWV